MIWIYITLPILTVWTLISLYVISNLLKKVEKQEELIEKQEEILGGYVQYLDKLSRCIEISKSKLDEIDSRGIFRSDDEVGFFFTNLKKIQDILNEFIVREVKL